MGPVRPLYFRGRKLIVEITCWVLVTPPIISGKVWDKSQSLPLQGITWCGWASEQKIWVNVRSPRRRSSMARFRHEWMRLALTWNRSRLANECDGWGGALLQNPIQTTLPPHFQHIFKLYQLETGAMDFVFYSAFVLVALRFAFTHVP